MLREKSERLKTKKVVNDSLSESSLEVKKKAKKKYMPPTDSEDSKWWMEILNRKDEEDEEQEQFINFQETEKTEEQKQKVQELYSTLKSKLMKVYKQKKGDKVSLCPQMLRELYDLLMLEFTEIEKASVAIYELQTYLIEVCVYPRDHFQGMRFEVFFNWILTTIRSDPKLWTKSSPMYQKVCKFLKKQEQKIAEIEKLAKENGKTVPKFYMPKIDENHDKIEKSNRISIEIYKKQMQDKREKNGDVEYYGSDQVKYQEHNEKFDDSKTALESEILQNLHLYYIYMPQNRCQTWENLQPKTENQPQIHPCGFYRGQQAKQQILDFKYAPLLYKWFEKQSQTSSQKLKLQNFILFILSKEKISSSFSIKRNNQRLQKEYENFIKSFCENQGISQTFNFLTKSNNLDQGNSRHVSHYYTMLAHGIDLQTMNSLQKHSNLDEYLKSSKKKKKRSVDHPDLENNKSWLEDFFNTMSPQEMEVSSHESEEQEAEQEEGSSSETDSEKSLESLIDTYNTEEEDAFLQYKIEGETLDLKHKLKEQKDALYTKLTGQKPMEVLQNEDVLSEKSDQKQRNLSQYSLRKKPAISSKFEDIQFDQMLSNKKYQNSRFLSQNNKKKTYKKVVKIKKTKYEVLQAINSDQKFLNFLHSIQSTFSLNCTEITPQIDQEIRDHITDFRNIHHYLSLSGKAYFFNIFQIVSEYCKCEAHETKALILPRDLKKFHTNLKAVRQGIMKDKEAMRSIVHTYKDIYEHLLDQRNSQEQIQVQKLCRIYEAKDNQKQPEVNFATSCYGDPKIENVISEFKKYQKTQRSYRPPDFSSTSHLASEAMSASPEKSPGLQKRPVPEKWEWSQDDFKKFYTAVELYKDHQFGNKKLAQYMGDITKTPVDAAQIRYEKFRYQKQKRKEERLLAIKKFSETQTQLKDINWAVVKKNKKI